MHRPRMSEKMAVKMLLFRKFLFEFFFVNQEHVLCCIWRHLCKKFSMSFRIPLYRIENIFISFQITMKQCIVFFELYNKPWLQRRISFLASLSLRGYLSRLVETVCFSFAKSLVKLQPYFSSANFPKIFRTRTTYCWLFLSVTAISLVKFWNAWLLMFCNEVLVFSSKNKKWRINVIFCLLEYLWKLRINYFR